MEINESPIYVLLNPTINPAAKDLPVTVYESGELWHCVMSMALHYEQIFLLPSLHRFASLAHACWPRVDLGAQLMLASVWNSVRP